jgi:ParB family chromosome partitioning protein
MSCQLRTVPLTEITFDKRHRTDLGDIEGLAASIDAVGLLQPLVVTPDLRLVAGRRRLEALKTLGRDTAAVFVVDTLPSTLLLLRAERDENTCRKDFTPSEAVAIGKALEELEREQARGRQAHAGPAEGKGRKASGSGKLPEPVRGQTRDKVAEAVGMSGRTYEKVKAVVEAAAADPALAPVVEQMDRTGKVDPAYKKVAGARNGAKAASDSAGLPGPPAGAGSRPDLAKRWPGLRYHANHLEDLSRRTRKLAAVRVADRKPEPLQQLIRNFREAVDRMEREILGDPDAS